MKLGMQDYLLYIILLKWLDLKEIVICLKLGAKFRFKGFLSVSALFRIKLFKLVSLAGNLAHKTIWYILLCYYVWNPKEYSYALNYVLSCIFTVLKCFLHFLTKNSSDLVCFT